MIDTITEVAERQQEKLTKCVLRVAKFFQIEELVRINVLEEDPAIIACESVKTRQLRQEVAQLLKVIRAVGYYLFLLTAVYLLQTILCWHFIDVADFKAQFRDQKYAEEMYWYSVEIEEIKLVHALTLMSIAGYLIFFTQKFKLLNQKHYHQILALAIVITIVYFIPIVWILRVGYRDSQASYLRQRFRSWTGEDTPEWEVTMIKFADWFYMILQRSEGGGGAGLLLSFFVHFQIYLLLFFIQWEAMVCRDVAIRIQKSKEESQGTYNATELGSGTLITQPPTQLLGEGDIQEVHPLTTNYKNSEGNEEIKATL